MAVLSSFGGAPVFGGGSNSEINPPSLVTSAPVPVAVAVTQESSSGNAWMPMGMTTTTQNVLTESGVTSSNALKESDALSTPVGDDGVVGKEDVTHIQSSQPSQPPSSTTAIIPAAELSESETASEIAIESGSDRVSAMLSRMGSRGKQSTAKKTVDRLLTRINTLVDQKARLKASIAQLAAEVASDVGEGSVDGLTREGEGLVAMDALTEGEKDAARDRGRMVRVAQLEHERQRLLQALENFDEEVGRESSCHALCHCT